MINRDTYRYVLKDGNAIVYYGITNDVERRKLEHEKEGKIFTNMQIDGPAVSKPTAEQWEESKLKYYRSVHRGNNPKYNIQTR